MPPRAVPLDGLVVASAGRKLLDATTLSPGNAVLFIPAGCKLDPRFLELLRDDALILFEPPREGPAAPPPTLDEDALARRALGWIPTIFVVSEVDQGKRNAVLLSTFARMASKRIEEEVQEGDQTMKVERTVVVPELVTGPRQFSFDFSIVASADGTALDATAITPGRAVLWMPANMEIDPRIHGLFRDDALMLFIGRKHPIVARPVQGN
jgi:hypothetical protein